jgi:molybdate transport system substrate-binding protein
VKEKNKNTITISVASSLVMPFNEIKERFNEKNSNVEILHNFGGSGSLTHQIDNGAKVDIFIPASLKYIKILDEKNMIEQDSIQNLLSNQIVLIKNKKNTSISSVTDILLIEKVALGEPNSVPAGEYAREVLENRNIYEKLQNKFVYGKNVREVLMWVETGNVDAGFVYYSDAKSSEYVEIVETFHEIEHSKIIYPLGVVKGNDKHDLVNEYISFLKSEEASSVFSKFGFSSLSNP